MQPEDTNTEPASADLALLEKAQKVIQLERKLTASLEKVEPWLLSNNNSTAAAATAASQHHRPRVRPIPTNMDQVEYILAVARNYASKTSAPAGWSVDAPLVGFSTPNPLPHQLRGGALAALQLERARAMAESNNKRKRQQQEEQEQQQKQEEEEEERRRGEQRGRDSSSNSGAVDPKRREVSQHEKELDRAKSDVSNEARQRMAGRKRQQVQQQQEVSMNLSDSGSSSDSDDD